MKKKNKGWSRAKPIIYDGITFKSGLEKYCYKKLKENKLFEKYEEETFEICSGFLFTNSSTERQANGKGKFTERGKRRVLGIKYTPDFTGKDYIIETKGYANPTFPIRYKLFKKWCTDNNEGRNIYKPQKQSEVDETIELIKNRRK